nr:reverse transcriptase domain-containing protein [Tanacetum cinerariifolium]
MRTRSQSRENFPRQEASLVIVEPLCIENPFLEDKFQEDPPKDPPEVSMADDRTLAELLRAPTKVYEDAIVIPEIAANNFKLKHDLINLVQNKQFFGHDKEDPHAHIRYFNKITSTMRVPNDSLYSAAGGNFLDKIPRECFKIIESKSKVHQTRAKADVAKVSTSSSTLAISSEVYELKDMVRALLLDKKNQSSVPASSSTPAPVKTIEPNCVTCGATHSYQNCPATSGNVYRDNIQEYVSQAAAANYNQGNTGFRRQMVANQIRPPGFPPHQNNQNNFNRGNNFNQNRGQLHRPQVNQPLAYQAPIPQTQSVSQTDFERYVKANDAVLRNIQSQGQRSGTLPGNTITNPKEDLKGITTRSGPPITTQSKVVKQGTEPVSVPMPNLKPSIPYPSRRDNERCRDQANEQIEKFYKIFKQTSFKISFTDVLILMPKFASTLKALIGNKEKLREMDRTLMNEHCSEVILNKLPRKLGDPDKFLIPCEFPGMDECLALADLGASINLLPLSVCEGLSLLEYTPTCMTFELANRLVSKPIGIAKDVSVKVGVFHFPADFVVVDFEQDPPSLLNSQEMFLKDHEQLPPLPNLEQYLPSYKKELKVYEAKTVKSSINEPPEVELKDLPSHLEYAFLEGDNKFPVIIAKELGDEDKSALIKDYKPAVQHQRQVNPKIHNVIKKEVEKLLDAGLIYPIFDSPWVSPGTNTIGSSMVSLGIFKFPLTLVIRKRQRSPAHMARLPIDACLSVCAMHRGRFKGVCCLNWEKSHFMVKEGIVLGHKISKNGIEVDKAKVDVIAKLPHPTTVKGIRSFLGHAGFYRQFIQDFSKISRPMTHLLEKNTPFVFSEDCIKAFQMLKKKLMEAPILIAPNWDLPFELMCDASDFAIGAVLGQRHEKHFKPIHYASKTMNDAESN